MTTITISEVNRKKFADKDLSLALHLDKLPKLVDKFNKLLVNNIRKEIKWYRKVKV